MTIVGLGLLTAIVVVLQLLSAGIHFGPFSVTFCLIPIIVGAALFGWKAGAWLGFVFSVVVLFTDAGAFLAINIPGTIITVILKGTLAGLAAGLVYTLISKKHKNVADYASVVISGIIAPVVNTGIFLLGCSVFFLDTIKAWGEGAGFPNAFAYMIFGMVGLNFLIELGVNLVLSSAIVLIIRVAGAIIKQVKK